ncbi:MAG: ASKHA domain-containing protein [Bacillota bacterium]|nr:ASKHA domain-containing protein [Bacillota bacterium]MDW7684858.1 ASKHA domain-containing protein [Bacillota bacterium]
MNNHKVRFLPEGKQVDAAEGMILKDVINEVGINFDFPCGGRGTCGKCRIRVVSGSDTLQEQETSLLTPDEQTDGIRLACLVEVNGNLTVELLAEKNVEHQILLSSLGRKARVKPHLIKRYIEVEKPTMADNRPDWQRVKDSLTKQDGQPVEVHYPALRTLPVELRKQDYTITAVLEQNRVRGVEAGNTSDSLLGIAFDIGTTTIVGYLTDLYTGRELSVVSALNPQTRYGADVIARITHTLQHDQGLDQLQRAVLGALDDLIGDAVAKAGVDRNDVYAISVVGNTCMHHLFLGISPRQLALSPYVPAISEPVVVDVTDLQLNVNKAGKVFVLPNIAGFVGADMVAVLLAAELDRSEDVKLIIDIGTNGEIALGSQEQLFACSAAAGPAFEGAQISCGMRGATGAIDHVTFGEQLETTVIGGGRALGVCGSALLDTVAGLLEAGLISEKGKFNDPDAVTNSAGLKYKERIIRHEGAWAFLLSDEPGGKKIMITQKDVRELQLAKGAIASGIQVLMNESGLEPADIKEVLLAGAFGNYLNPHSACVLGLIPPELEDRVTMIGNAAGAGAKLALVSVDEYQRAAALAGKVKFVELGANRNFNHIFASSMLFPSQT